MPPRPNVVLITVDSLRADVVDDEQVPTPSFDQLRTHAVTYKQAFAQGPFTTFSMPSLFTSQYPSSLSYLEFSDSTVGVYIDDEPTLPEVLQQAGYETAGFHSNPLLSHLFGFDRGFDTFDSRLPLSGFDTLPGRLKILTDKLLRLARKHAYLPAEKLTARAVDWLDSRPDDRPFFCWIHYMDVHGPYQAHSGNAYLNKFRGERIWRKAVTRPDEITEREHDRLWELYQKEVTYTDRWIGELLDGLKQRGILDETLCAVTADHGEQFDEHGLYSHPHQLYDELTHVPLIIADPDQPAADSNELVELVDLAPTLLGRAGTNPPEAFAGHRLGTDDRDTTAAISEANLSPQYTGAVRTSKWKYIRTGDEEDLYNLATDPREQTNCAEQEAKKTAELAAILDEHLAEQAKGVGAAADVKTHEISDHEVKERLQDLGYLGDN